MQSTSVAASSGQKSKKALQLGINCTPSLPLQRNVKLCSLGSSKEKHLSQLVSISMTGWTDFFQLWHSKRLARLVKPCSSMEGKSLGQQADKARKGGHKLAQEATSSPSGASGLAHWAICVWLQHFMRDRAQHVKIRDMFRSASFSCLGCKLVY